MVSKLLCPISPCSRPQAIKSMEEVRCALCGKENNDPLLRAKDIRYHLTDKVFSLVQCSEGGLVYVNPRPTLGEMSDFYPKGYYDEGSSVTRLVSFFYNLATIRKITKYKKSGRILDLGCGDGNFLLEMDKRGFDVYGVDTSPEACRIASKRLDKNFLRKWCLYEDYACYSKKA